MQGLLRRSHVVEPDEMPAVIADAAEAIGWQVVGLYLVDLEQRLLTAVNPETDPPLLAVDTTMAGRAFVTGEIHRGEQSPVWVPLVDGADRVGVIGIDAASASRAGDDDLLGFGSIVTLLLLAKTKYTDAYTATRRRQDMSVASEMQWARLPPLTLSTPRVGVSAIVEPVYALGGDAFDYAVNGDVLHVAVLDAKGHGLDATSAVSLAIGGLRHARRRFLDLPATYRAVDGTLAAGFGEEDFVTAQIGQLDLVTSRLRWISAGHPAPLLLRGSKVIGPLRSEPSLPLGLGGRVEMVAETQLEPWDRVLFFTDGVVEGRTREGEPFGEERLADSLSRESLAGNGTAETVRRLAHTILDHYGHDLSDDFTLVLVEARAEAEAPGTDESPAAVRVAGQRTL